MIFPLVLRSNQTRYGVSLWEVFLNVGNEGIVFPIAASIKYITKSAMFTRGNPARFNVHSLAVMVKGLGRMCLSTNLWALHAASGVCSMGSCKLRFLGKFRRFSNCFVVPKHAPFSLVCFQVFSTYFRSFVSNFREHSFSLTRYTFGCPDDPRCLVFLLMGVKHSGADCVISKVAS